MPLLAVSAHDIDAAGRPLDTVLPVAWLDQELSDAKVRATAPGRIRVRLSRSGSHILVRGSVGAKVVTQCARCTEPAEFEVAAELSLLLKASPAKPQVPAAARPVKAAGDRPDARPTPARPAGKKKSREPESEYEFSADEADVDTFDGETVVLDEFVREAILLELPIFPLCSENCPGIRPGASPASAGAHKPSVDPRLAPLGALRDKLEQAAHAAQGGDKTSPGRGASPPLAAAKSSRKKTKKE